MTYQIMNNGGGDDVAQPQKDKRSPKGWAQ